MDTSFTIKPLPGVVRRTRTRPDSSAPVGETAESQLASSQTVTATTDNNPTHQDRSHRDEGYDVSIDPDARDTLYRERSAQARPGYRTPDQALQRQRAYAQPTNETERPSANAPAADVEA